MSEANRADRSKPTMAFWLGCLAIFAAGLTAATRAATAGTLKADFLDPVDPAHSAMMIGVVLGAAFLGFSLMLVVTSTMLDRIGMKRMLTFASVAFIAGSSIVIGCDFAPSAAIYTTLVTGMFIIGLGWGAVEGTVNPMVAALYPRDTTHWMNMLHAWWPAGLIVGGLVGVLGTQAGLDWRVISAALPLVAIVLGVLVLRCDFPPTTSVSMGVRRSEQFAEIVRRPMFLIWFVLMLFTAATELAPGQWVDVALTSVVGMRGLLLLVYVAGIQFVGRHFSGPLAHRLSPEGLLCVSCLLSAVGLYGLAIANSPVTALAAATFWGLGVCYLWPTMVAVVAVRYPRGGALTIGLMGVAGSLSSYFVLPVLGSIYDTAKLEAAGGADALALLDPAQLQRVLVFAASESFKSVALIPVALTVIFAILWMLGRKDVAVRPDARAAETQ